jgi:hypothetical protein
VRHRRDDARGSVVDEDGVGVHGLVSSRLLPVIRF